MSTSELPLASEQSTQLVLPKLNIPNASTFRQGLVEKQRQQQEEVVKQQLSVIETAFVDCKDQSKVTFQLDQELASEHAQLLQEQGYNISQSYTFSSHNNNLTNGKYIVTLRPQSEKCQYNHHHGTCLNQFDLIHRLFSQAPRLYWY